MRKIWTIALFLCVCQALAQKVSSLEAIREADLLISDYQFNKALTVMRHADDSLHEGLLHRKGLCYSRLGNHAEAIAVYQTLTSSDSLNREALYNLGQLYSVSEQYKEAKTCYEKLLRIDSINSFYQRQYAAAAVRGNDPVTAISGYLQAVTLNPGDMEAYVQLSGLLLEADQNQFVDSMLTSVLARNDYRPLRLLLARANLAEEKYSQVIENIGMLLERQDTSATAARLLGISYFQLEQYEKVIPCMEFLIANDIEADWIFYYLGVSYLQTNNPQKGIEFLNRAIEEGISDHIGTYYTQLAMAYEEMKDFKNAIRSYKLAYETSKAGILLYHLARNYDVYYKDKQQARIFYRKYLESDDTIKMAKAYSQQRLEVLSDVR